MALSDLQLLAVLETLVKLAKSGASASAALVTVAGARNGGDACLELAKLEKPDNVKALAVKLGEHAAGVFAPPIVAEAAAMLRDPKRAAWIQEVGRLAAAR